MESYFIFTLLLLLLSGATLSQLTETDRDHIKKTILSTQDESTGFFEKSVSQTLKAIYSLRASNEVVPMTSKICQKISSEWMNEKTPELIGIDTALDCKLNLKISEVNIDKIYRDDDLNSLYKKAKFANQHLLDFNYENLYENVKPYFLEGKLFSNHKESQTPSLRATVKGLRILIFIQTKVEGPTKTLVEEELANIVYTLLREFTLIREDIGLFTEEQVSSLKLNSELAETLLSVNKIVKIENLYELLSKILNYFVTFKYDYNGLDSVYYLIKGIKTLKEFPIVKLDTKVIDYLEEKKINLSLLNGFGDSLTEYKVEYSYKLKESKDEKIKTEYDLEDEPEPEVTFKATGGDKTSIDLSEVITSPGEYTLMVEAKLTNPNGENFSQKFSLDLVSTTKIKLDHLKMSVSKSDEKEITVEYPKRNFKNFKADGNKTIKIRVKFDASKGNTNTIEQVYLRLRHTELGKSYSAYVSQYKETDDYYVISFDLSDPNLMDAYDGLYELTLIVSDISLDNPVIWNFGKIDVKFKKPLDPTNIVTSFKNKQKEKMEPHFPAEESFNKNIISSIFFSGILMASFAYYLIKLKSDKANMQKFPKASSGTSFIFAIVFVLIFLLIIYVFVLFFLKLNIIQTMIALAILILPGSFVTFKALSKIKIEI